MTEALIFLGKAILLGVALHYGYHRLRLWLYRAWLRRLKRFLDRRSALADALDAGCSTTFEIRAYILRHHPALNASGAWLYRHLADMESGGLLARTEEPHPDPRVLLPLYRYHRTRGAR